MCQPGRPRPNGASQAAPTASSAGSAAFQSAKSRRVLLGVLVRADPLAGPGPQLPPVEPGEPAVAGEPGDAEVHRAVLRLVGDPPVQQPLDQLDHRGDVLGGPRLGVRRPDPEPVAVFLERASERVHMLPERHALGRRRRDGAVVDVRQVHDVEDLEPARLEPAAQEVLEQEGPEVSDVGVVVDRGPAGVQRRPPRVKGHERLDLAGEGVVEPESHPPAAPAALSWRSDAASSMRT